MAPARLEVALQFAIQWKFPYTMAACALHGGVSVMLLLKSIVWVINFTGISIII